MGWSGYRYDQPTRLYAVRFRFYDAVTFRWLNRDPAGYVDSMNLYGYGVSNPTAGLDPFGLDGGPRFAAGAGIGVGEGDIAYDPSGYSSRGLLWWATRSWSNYFAVGRGGLFGFLHGYWHGMVMAADNLTFGIAPGLSGYADDIRGAHATNPWYKWGDRSSAVGAFLLWTLLGFRALRPELGKSILPNSVAAEMFGALGTRATGLQKYFWLVSHGYSRYFVPHIWAGWWWRGFWVLMISTGPTPAAAVLLVVASDIIVDVFLRPNDPSSGPPQRNTRPASGSGSAGGGFSSGCVHY